MVSNPKCDISVVIPVYNVEKFLPRCLDSVLMQTFTNIEIICINDGSEDGCPTILKEYAAKDKRLRIVSQPNRGLSAARNVGLDMANGEYIFFLDSDDFLHPQTLDIFYNVALKTNAPLIISSDFNKFYDENYVISDNFLPVQDTKYKLSANPLRDLYKYRIVSSVAWNKLFRADCIKSARFIEGISFEDWPFITCLVSSLKTMAVINEKLYMYNAGCPSITRSPFSVKKIHDYMVGIYHVYNYFQQKGDAEQWKLVQNKRVSVSLKMVLSKISKSAENRDELEKYFKKEYKKLTAENIVNFNHLSFKSKCRLLCLMWHQRH